MIDDVLFDMLDDYNFDMFYDYSFEIIFRNYFHFPQKRIVLTVRLRLFTFRYRVSTISESNLLCFAFWYDIWLSFRNEQCVPIFILKCFMTIISKWGGKIFVYRIIFVKRIGNILLTKIPHFIYFSYTVFYARLGPYPCVEIKFLEKGDGLLCQILIILQC